MSDPGRGEGATAYHQKWLYYRVVIVNCSLKKIHGTIDMSDATPTVTPLSVVTCDCQLGQHHGYLHVYMTYNNVILLLKYLKSNKKKTYLKKKNIR